MTIEKTVIALYMQGENEISENIFATTEISKRKITGIKTRYRFSWPVRQRTTDDYAASDIGTGLFKKHIDGEE